ncbi:thioredoxin domain-containing protein 5-like isoform X2 [Montipora capricornis]|uniref:thioredoxin domain-containing protein 5-like isoform X2 n=2 Tax=Montipora TaxID=46703 RepID=UPI0035F1A1A3
MAAKEILIFFLSTVISPSLSDNVLSLTDVDFEDRVFGSSSHFVMFYGPWCEHCQNFMPTWSLLAEHYSKIPQSEHVAIAKVDCTKETPLCAKQNIRAYPTLKLYFDHGEIKRYNGKRRMNDLKAFVNKFLATSEEKEKDITETNEPDNGLYTLTADNFDRHVEMGLHFIKFYAPWCSHCRKLAPTWKELAEFHKDNMDITIAKIDCTTEGKTCAEHKIQGFPSLKLFKDGREVDIYEGPRSLDDLKNYLTLKISEHSLLSSATTDNSESAEEVPSDDDPDMETQIKPFQLTDSTFDAMISVGTTFVKFYAPWCRHCQELAPIWDQLANKCADSSSGPRIAKVDCTEEEELCQSFGISAYPTLILFSRGVQKQEYKGPRDLNSLYNFAVQHHDEL